LIDIVNWNVQVLYCKRLNWVRNGLHVVYRHGELRR